MPDIGDMIRVYATIESDDVLAPRCFPKPSSERLQNGSAPLTDYASFDLYAPLAPTYGPRENQQQFPDDEDHQRAEQGIQRPLKIPRHIDLQYGRAYAVCSLSKQVGGVEDAAHGRHRLIRHCMSHRRIDVCRCC